MSLLWKSRCRTRRALVMLALLFMGVLSIQAETAFRIGPKVTWSYGDIHEYVYMSRPYNKLSQLDWAVHNVVQFGVAAELTHDRLILSTDFYRVEDVECGLMQDYDWFYLFVLNPDHPVSTVTEFSEHPVTLLEKDQFSLNAGLKVLNGRKLSLAAGAGFHYILTSLEGNGGYLQHSTYEDRYLVGYTNDNVSPYDPDRPKYQLSDSQKVIAYQQKIESLWITLRADVKPVSWFSVGIEGGISPWQMFDCYDFHYVTNAMGMLYNDKPLSSVMYRGSLSSILNLSKRSSLVFAGSVLSLPYTEGNSYSNNNDVPTAGTLGGTSYLGWDVSLSYLIRIF